MAWPAGKARKFPVDRRRENRERMKREVHQTSREFLGKSSFHGCGDRCAFVFMNFSSVSSSAFLKRILCRRFFIRKLKILDEFFPAKMV